LIKLPRQIFGSLTYLVQSDREQSDRPPRVDAASGCLSDGDERLAVCAKVLELGVTLFVRENGDHRALPAPEFS
jgi:hypothetical protein